MEDRRWKIEDARVGGMIAGHDLPPPPKRRTLHSNSNLELELPLALSGLMKDF